ncbi:hypothetical protein MHK_000512 [Candidatus Magnetomorum sp. HK-1]|nr:hypothetical protein MHK_000512 [Candidatus Magnetomorum sp. HK-1]
MLPIFFPSTYIDKATLDTCLKWFQQLVIYQPSDLDIPEHYDTFLADKSIILRVPLAPHIDNKHLMQERLHLSSMGKELGTNMSHIKGMPETPPFYNELSVNHIRSQIKKESPKNENAEHKPLLTALFLHLIQDFEIQQEDLNQKLIDIEKSEKQLFEMLKDENLNATSLEKNNTVQNNWGPDHTLNRLKAWFFMYQNDPDKTGIFLTDSRDVFSEIEEWNPNLKLALSLNEQAHSEKVKEVFWHRICDFVNGADTIQTNDLGDIKDTAANLQIYSQKGLLTGPFITEHNKTKEASVINTCLLFLPKTC